MVAPCGDMIQMTFPYLKENIIISYDALYNLELQPIIVSNRFSRMP